MRKSFALLANYHQILLTAGPEVAALETFTDADCRRRLVAGPGIVVVMTERNMTVPVTLEVLAAAPPLPAGDHIAEASLDLSGGRLCVQGLMDVACEELPVAPGAYRVRLVGSGYATLSADALEGEDRYDLTLWPAPMAEAEVLRQWEG